MNESEQNVTLDEAATRFLTTVSPEKRGMSQQEVYKFVRWCGRGQSLAVLTPPEVANYAERLSLSDTGYTKKLKLVRAFLTFANKSGWCQANLAIHLKPGKKKAILQSMGRQNLPKHVSLTQQGYAELEAKLTTLKSKRLLAIDEMRKAAADKDFRENAPLDAAKEQRGHLEGQIKELEEALKSSTVIDEKQKVTPKVGIGDSVTLSDLASTEELHYTIVNPREADPLMGKISSASPIGKAIIGRSQGEIIEVTAPVGKLRYQIREAKQ